MSINWDAYMNFTKEEFDCKETGKNEMRPEFMILLQAIREDFGKPMVITSGYRDKSHSVERNKMISGAHTLGVAADIAVSGDDATQIIKLAIGRNIRRIGVQQKGAKDYLHIDIADRYYNFKKTIWSY